MQYLVGVTIYTTFQVEADDEQGARNLVLEMDNDDILRDADFNVNYVDEVTPKPLKG